MGKGVELTWRGGEHEFKLTIDLLRALQDKCDAGPQHIFERLANGLWMINDVTETIRLGLEGGGVEKEAARRLVKLHVEDRPLTEAIMTARLVLMAALFGAEEDAPGEVQAGEVTTPTHSREESGGSPVSTSGAE
ncbi:gene transfer agent family protein [Neorhizobium sp. JUb45]|uniref:gene transfer agent family protein n=1 Tax=Neorhizobium sp. JUb45 TaxID=2485113 RepID=UPI001052C619|nr:gene transfer agent family protein [Neorhizobium sp. JUb45]TCR01064.1 tail tube GTA-gp10-like protein [Neorhizobium sp. JUb45]